MKQISLTRDQQLGIIREERRKRRIAEQRAAYWERLYGELQLHCEGHYAVD